MCAHARKTKRIIWFFLHIQGCNLLTGRKSLKCSSKKEKKKKKRESLKQTINIAKKLKKTFKTNNKTQTKTLYNKKTQQRLTNSNKPITEQEPWSFELNKTKATPKLTKTTSFRYYIQQNMI